MKLSGKDFKIGDKVIFQNPFYGRGTVVEKKPANGRKGFICVKLDKSIQIDNKKYDRYWTFPKGLTKVVL